MYIKGEQDRRKKRCQDIAPLHGLQCRLPKKHNQDRMVVHKAGSLIWHGGGAMMAPINDFVTKIDLGPNFKPTGSHHIDVQMPDLHAENVRQGFERAFSFGGMRVHAACLKESSTDARSPAERELAEWWTQGAEDEVARTVPKAIEYGSTDLIDIGLMLARTMKRDIDQEEAAELGVFFYLIGKIARWQSAIERGERPSDDTLFDIGVYVRMAQRIRAAGGWPGVDAMHSMCTIDSHDGCLSKEEETDEPS